MESSGYSTNTERPVEHPIAARVAVFALAGNLVRRRLEQVEAVVDRVADGAAEQPVDGLATVLAAKVPQRVVDAGEGKARHLGPAVQGASAEEVTCDRFPVPGVAADDQGRDVAHRGLDRRGARKLARAFTPADEPVVGAQLDDHLGGAVAPAAGALAPEGDVDDRGLETGDFHGVPPFTLIPADTNPTGGTPARDAARRI